MLFAQNNKRHMSEISSKDDKPHIPTCLISDLTKNHAVLVRYFSDAWKSVSDNMDPQKNARPAIRVDTQNNGEVKYYQCQTRNCVECSKSTNTKPEYTNWKGENCRESTATTKDNPGYPKLKGGGSKKMSAQIPEYSKKVQISCCYEIHL